MQFTAKAKYIWYSAYKLRPIVNVIRGKDVIDALSWLMTYRTQRAEPIEKVIKSALANAKNNGKVEAGTLIIKDIRVDQGPTHSYYKPGAMGRAMPQRKKLSHISVILENRIVSR